MFFPYLKTIALAAALAILVSPIHRRLIVRFKGARSLSAALITLLVIIAVALPVAFISFQIFQESRDLYNDISANRATYLETFNQLLRNTVGRYFPQFKLDTTDLIKQGATWIISNFNYFFASAITTIGHGVLGLIALFYLLRDGDKFTSALMDYSPLPDRYDRDILSKLQTAVQSVFRGSLLVALIQGVLTAIGLTIFGVPSPALWGSIAAICALIPGVGTSLILIPAILYLFLTGQDLRGIGLTIWAVFAVGLIDNVLGPSLIGQGIRIHPLIILFSVIGGISLFGPLGFIFGPLSVSLLMALLEIYRIMWSRKGEKLPF